MSEPTNRRVVRFWGVALVALVVLPFTPVFLERSFVRSSHVGHRGDVVESGWKLTSLKTYWEDYGYLRPEQHPAPILGLNLALLALESAGIAYVVDRIARRRSK